ncbi:MAG: DUF4249 domain-containing protein [Tannerella sp.]|jgi:hypothetical protein|nr:DUF4249 domain-containing protein [Tannerella sp.]
MKTLFVSILLVLVFSACTADYNMKSTDVDEPNRLVVNSFLNPEKPIRINFYTLDRTDTGFVCRTAENLYVKLTEDDRTLFEGWCADSMLILDHHPRVNVKYRIDVSLTGYASVWAETTVPSSIMCKVRAEPFSQSYHSSEMKYFLSDFAGNHEREKTSLYVQVYSMLGGDTLMPGGDMYASNVLLDPMNRTNGIEVKDADVGSSCHERFIRVKNRNLPYLDHLIFITAMPYGYYHHYTEENRVVWISFDVKKYLVKLITAGPDYDMYRRTLYQQAAYIVYDDDISAFTYHPVQVYSNISGGLGIFAGINETDYFFDAPEQSDQP